MIRRPRIETRINHERWLVSYADFITLLFAFFVVMYSVSQISDTKYRELSQTLQSTFSDKTFSDKMVTRDQQKQLEPIDPSQPAVEPLPNIALNIQQELTMFLELGAVTITGNKEKLEIELDANTLFASGSAELNDQAMKVLRGIGDQLALNANQIIVSGHTDNQPINTEQYPNNWALSSARAVAVVNALAYQGVSPERLSAVGYGEYQPLASNATEAGRQRNRRVVIEVTQNVVRPVAPEEIAPILGEPNVATPGGQRPESASDLEEPSVQPVKLRDGSLLFTNDPTLPRVNPVQQPTPEESP